MSELILAPSPSPAASASNAAVVAATPPAGNGAAENSDVQQAAGPFSAILQRQMAHPVDAKAAKAIAALLVAQNKGGADKALPLKEADPADSDMISFLAPMLAGVTPAQGPSAAPAAATAANDKDDKAAADVQAQLVAAPLTAPVLAGPALKPVASTESTADKSDRLTVVADAPGDHAEKPSAILAAATPVVAENATATGKTGTASTGTQPDFNAALLASRDASMAAAHAVATAGAHVPAATARADNQIATAVGAPGWDSEIGTKLTWMSNNQQTRAEFVLNPPQLGRIEVSLSMNGDQANATFVSASPAVREALESAVPRLREILGDAGISLGQANVGAESFQQSADKRENGDNLPRSNGAESGVISGSLVSGGSTAARWMQRGNGLVDTFA